MVFKSGLTVFILAIAVLLWGFYLRDLERLMLENHCLLTALGNERQDRARITALQRRTVRGWRRPRIHYRMVLERADGYALLDLPRAGADGPGLTTDYEYYRLAALHEVLAAHGEGAEVAVRWTRNTLYTGSRPILLSVAGRDDFGTCHTWDLFFLLLPTIGLLVFSVVFGGIIVALWVAHRRG